MWDRRGGDGRIVWEREDGHAVLTVRETATGEWAVTLDRLSQAPRGAAYARETVGSRSAALALADRWRDRHDAAPE